MGVRGKGFRKELRGGKTHLVIDFRYRDKNGRIRRFRRDASVQTATSARVEAERLYAQAVATGSLDATKIASPTFASFVATTFAELFMTKYRSATRIRYEALFRQGLTEVLGSKPLDEIGARDIRAYASRLAERGVQHRGPINLIRTVLRSALELGLLDAMPDLPKLGGQSKKLPDAPTVEEIAAMLTVATGWLKVAIALAAFAGLRMGEVRAIEVRDVDLARDRLLIRRALSEDELMTPKSGHERLVPLLPELKELLVEAVHRKPPTARVIMNTAGKTSTRQNLLTTFKAMLARNGLKERSFHSLRHFFCSTLIQRGASVEAVRLLAGHSALAVTARYLHATNAELASAVAKLGGRNELGN